MGKGAGTTATASGPLALSRKARASETGIDCLDQLEWRNWRPGGEYVRSMVVKNVCMRVLKLKYKLPASKLFSMEYPEPIRLSPGMSYAVKVTFRPVKREAYNDFIEFSTGSATFVVPIRACLPTVDLALPGDLDFGFVAVKGAVRRPFTVRNTGEASVLYEWKLQAPFSIQPPAGKLAAGESAAFEAVFEPQDASVYTAAAVCRADNGFSSSMQLTGIGKFPFLALDCGRLDFGDVLVGEAAEQVVRLANHSAVPSTFTVAPQPGEPWDGVFTVTPSKGTLGPEETVLLTLAFTPAATGTYSYECLSIAAPAGNKVSMTLSGNALGPSVGLSTSSVNFGSVQSGQSLSRVLYIENKSHIPAYFQMVADAAGVFALDRVRGSVGPMSSTHVTIAFAPKEASNYWKRVTCLVKDGAALHVDLLGCCFTDKMHPPPLSQRHIDEYLISAASAPTSLPRMLQDSLAASAQLPANPTVTRQARRDSMQLPSDEGIRNSAAAAATDGGPAAADAGPAASAMVLRLDKLTGQRPTEPDMQTRSDRVTFDVEPMSSDEGEQAPIDGLTSKSQGVPTAWEGLFEGTDAIRAVTVDASELDFGACSRLRMGDYKTLTVTNRTGVKITAFVSVPEWRDPTSTDAPCAVFQAFPDQADIRPHGTATFRLAFRPPKDGQYYSQLVDVVAFVKAMRNFRLVAPEDLCPPWTLPVQVVGNTFLHRNEEFETKAELSTQRIDFPPCRANETVYQTLMVMNHGDKGFQWEIVGPKLYPRFGCKPRRGVVGPKSWQLVALRFQSEAPGHFTALAKCVINNSQTNALPLALSGSACVPELVLGASGALFFKPTCMGAASQRSLALHNASRIPLAFQWAVPQRWQRVFHVSPREGILRGNERAEVQWRFVPNAQKEMECRVACHVGGAAVTPAGLQAGSFADGDHLSLRLVGDGTQGALTLDPSNLDLGTVAVGFPFHTTLTLINQSDGNLRYTMRCVALPSSSSSSSASSDSMQQLGSLPSGIMQADNETGMATTAAFSLDADADGQAVSSEATDPTLEAAARHLTISEPEGSIPARAYKTLKLTLNPVHRLGYTLQLQCQTSSGQPIEASATACTAAEDAEARGPPPVCATLTAFATYPTVLVTDVACPGIGKPFLWDQMSCSQINAELLSELSEVELSLRARMLDGSFTTALALSQLPPCTLDLGLATLGTHERTVHFHIRNPGALPVEWDIQGQNDIGPGVEMENWVEHSRPRNNAERLRDFIVDNAIFEVQPRSGRLALGEHTVMTVTYRPLALGPHTLPMLLNIRDGKLIRLQLSGATVPEDTVALSLKERTFTLAPVPIGEAEPPLQTYTLRNGGPAILDYAIDTTPFRQLTADSYDFEVLTLQSPATGTIPCGGTAQLNLRFRPLEARLYSLDVPVRLGDGRTEIVRLQGRGYHPDQPTGDPQPLPAELVRDRAAQPGFAAEARLHIDGQLGTVSQEVVSFGMVPQTAIVRRLVILTSCSLIPVSFTWDYGSFRSAASAGMDAEAAASHSVIDGRLQISPAQGQLGPGEACMVKLTFTGGMQPQLFEGEVHVTFTPTQDGGTTLATARSTLSGRVHTSSTVLTNSTGTQLQAEESEVLLQDPPAPQPGSTLQRLPVHLATTHSACRMLTSLQSSQQAALERSMAKGTQHAQRPQALLPSQPQVVIITLEGRVLTAQQVKSGHYALPSERAADAGRHTAAAAWTPPPCGPLPNASAELPAQGAELADLAGIMEGLLADVLADDDIATAFQNAPVEAVPIWADIRSSELPSLPQPSSRETTTPADSDSNAVPPDVTLVPAPQGDVAELMPTSSASTGQAANSQPDSSQLGSGDPIEAVLQQPEFQAFAEFVLESAIAGILVESATEGSPLA